MNRTTVKFVNTRPENNMSSHTKRRRLNRSSSDKDNKPQKTRNIFKKVLFQKDYLTTICSLLQTKNIFRTVAPLSSFHHDFVNNIQQSKLIHKCIEYDFGKKFLHQLNIQLQFDAGKQSGYDDDEDDENINISVSDQLSPLYTSFSYIYDKAIESPNIDYCGNEDDIVCDFSLLTSFENVKVLNYWYYPVKLNMFYHI